MTVFMIETRYEDCNEIVTPYTLEDFDDGENYEFMSSSENPNKWIEGLETFLIVLKEEYEELNKWVNLL